MRTLITNGLLVDGTGAPGQPGALALENGLITGMGAIDPSGFDEVIDAKGCAIAQDSSTPTATPIWRCSRSRTSPPSSCRG